MCHFTSSFDQIDDRFGVAPAANQKDGLHNTYSRSNWRTAGQTISKRACLVLCNRQRALWEPRIVHSQLAQELSTRDGAAALLAWAASRTANRVGFRLLAGSAVAKRTLTNQLLRTVPGGSRHNFHTSQRPRMPRNRACCELIRFSGFGPSRQNPPAERPRGLHCTVTGSRSFQPTES